MTFDSDARFTKRAQRDSIASTNLYYVVLHNQLAECQAKANEFQGQ